jgi:TonB-dependent receptor
MFSKQVKRSNESNNRANSWVYGLAVTLPVFLVGTPVALAQDAESDELEEIVVHGIRYSQQQAIGIKRNAIGVVDAISADDIGKLPVKNAAEAVNRLPGVSISTDQGEGRYVIVRGVSASLNNLTINGQSAGSPDDGGGRASPLDVVGGDLLQSIEVIKTPTPDMDGQGIGGTVNVVTPSAFSREEQSFGSVTLRAGHEDFSNNSPYAGNFTYGIKNAAGTVGFLVGGSYSYRDYIARGIFQDDWRDLNSRSTDGSSTTEWIPEATKNNHYNLERTRTALNAGLEFRPDDSTKYYIRGYYSKFDEDEERQRYQHAFSRDPYLLDGLTGFADSGRRNQDLRLEQKDKRFANISVGGENSLANGWTTDYGLQYNANRQEEPNRNWDFRSGRDFDGESWVIDGRGVVELTPGLSDPLDPNLIDFRRIRLQDNQTDEKSMIAHVDFQKDIEWGGKSGFIKMGAKYATTERDNDASRIRYNLGDVDWTMGDFGHSGDPFLNEVDGYLVPNILINPGVANAFFDENVNNTDYFELDAEDTFNEQFESDYLIDETVIAGYLMASLDLSDTQNVVFGARFESTDIDSTGYRRSEDPVTGDFIADALTAKGDYTNVLPSIVYRWNASERLVVRAAVTSAIGRPGFSEIANRSEFEAFTDPVTLETFGSINVGNPNLKPHESLNLDFSLEYYIGNAGIASAAAFYKDIDNFIFGYSLRCDTINGDDASCEFEGVQYDVFNFSSTENAESATISGIELNYQQGFDFLPEPWNGFGVGVSAAFIDSEMKIPGRDFEQTLLEQPDWTSSFMVFYQTDRFEATLAIDDSSEYLDDINGDDGTEDIYKEGYGRLDFKASYAFSDRYSGFFEWQNINDEPLEESQANVKRWNTQIETYGQTFTLGVSATF